ncbi:MAG: CotH kinase family protein [Balneolaceae bacterium]
MSKKSVLFLLLAFLTSNGLIAQTNWVFDDNSLPTVNITINPDSLNFILDGNNRDSDHEFMATFSFTRNGNTETVDSVGFRLRGNTSRDSQKKSYKVSFNTFIKGNTFYGLDKLNLNGEHNDPTILRAKLSWDIFEEADVVAPRAAHTKLYINNEYYGLYINVEHIDDKFVTDRFGSDAGNLYKALYPADLTYHDSNPETYQNLSSNGRPYYELKTNKKSPDFSDLANLIKFLDTASDERIKNEIEDYINLDGVLRWMAIDILTGNWDNYWYNKNNYYLYFEPKSNRFEFIPYDYDNTFGIDFVGKNWGTRDVNNWGANESRPLTDRILAIPEFKNRLHFYINDFITSFFNETTLSYEIDRLYTLTKDAAILDTYRVLDYDYTISQYHASFTNSIGGHVKYGLKPYITTRANSATNQIDLQNIAPIFRSVHFSTNYNGQEKNLVITASVLDEDSALNVKALFLNNGNEISLLDNGIGADVKANDGIYTGTYNLSGFAGNLDFYLTATDGSSSSSRYPAKPNKLLSASIRNITSGIVINEFMASNKKTIADETGEFVDYIEVFNNGSTLSLDGYYLTDNFQKPDKWAFPDTVLGSGEAMLIWADSDTTKGANHASFGLSKAGEEIAIFRKNQNEFVLIDSVSFGPQESDQAYGRLPNGKGSFQILGAPSPGMANDISINSKKEEKAQPKSIELKQNYPNPFNPDTSIPFRVEAASKIRLEVYSIAGQFIQTLTNQVYPVGEHEIKFNASNFSSGVYLYTLSSKNTSLTKKLVLIK